MYKKILGILSTVTLLGGAVYLSSQGGFGSLSSSVLSEEEVCSIQSYEEQISTTRNNIAQAQEKIRSIQQSIQENNKNISTLRQTLKERQIDLKQALSDKKKCVTGRITNQSCIIKADTYIGNLQDAIKNLENKIKENKDAIAEKNKNMVNQQKNIKKWNQDIASLSEEKTQCEERINTVNPETGGDLPPPNPETNTTGTTTSTTTTTNTTGTNTINNGSHENTTTATTTTTPVAKNTTAPLTMEVNPSISLQSPNYGTPLLRREDTANTKCHYYTPTEAQRIFAKLKAQRLKDIEITKKKIDRYKKNGDRGRLDWELKELKRLTKEYKTNIWNFWERCSKEPLKSLIATSSPSPEKLLPKDGADSLFDFSLQIETSAEIDEIVFEIHSSSTSLPYMFPILEEKNTGKEYACYLEKEQNINIIRCILPQSKSNLLSNYFIVKNNNINEYSLKSYLVGGDSSGLFAINKIAGIRYNTHIGGHRTDIINNTGPVQIKKYNRE